MIRPCSSAWTRCSCPGLSAYAPSSAGTGLCFPEVGGVERYLTGDVVCPRPSLGSRLAMQPDASMALAKSASRHERRERQRSAHAVPDQPPPARAALRLALALLALAAQALLLLLAARHGWVSGGSSERVEW